MPDHPEPRDLVDDDWDETERFNVGDYLRSAWIRAAAGGPARCLICDEYIGNNVLTGGTYAWMESLAHYVDEHRVRPPQEVVAHALARLDELDSGPFSSEWWVSATR